MSAPSPATCADAIDTVIVGTGPSALILSFLLHGNVPQYSGRRSHAGKTGGGDSDDEYGEKDGNEQQSVGPRHPDEFLHVKLQDPANLLDLNVGLLTEHFEASPLAYSDSARRVNVLIDTLLRPLADTEPGRYASCIEWRHDPARQVPHVLLGDTTSGGQWAVNSVGIDEELGTLSYLEQLSLPGYSFEDHMRSQGRVEDWHFLRPSRRDVQTYLAAYPAAVGIADALQAPAKVQNVQRTPEGFYIGSHRLHCKHLVLASGIFTHFSPVERPLSALLSLPRALGEADGETPEPLLIVGSGLTAADLILTHLPQRRIIHLFHWDPEERPSPLKACHRDAYPEYAGVYQRMKRAAQTMLGADALHSPLVHVRSDPLSHYQELDARYEGLPNAAVEEASVNDHGQGCIVLRLPDGTRVKRLVQSLQHVTGRRGSLAYLDQKLQHEILGPQGDPTGLSRQTLQIRRPEQIELAPDVFVIGSLSGDSLIRYASGTCFATAGAIMKRYHADISVRASISNPHVAGADSKKGPSVDIEHDDSVFKASQQKAGYARQTICSSRSTCIVQ